MMYLDIVLKEDIEKDNGVSYVSKKQATRYEPLRRISIPAYSGYWDGSDDVVITHEDGSTENLRGIILDTGECDE